MSNDGVWVAIHNCGKAYAGTTEAYTTDDELGKFVRDARHAGAEVKYQLDPVTLGCRCFIPSAVFELRAAALEIIRSTVRQEKAWENVIEITTTADKRKRLLDALGEEDWVDPPLRLSDSPK